MATRCIVSALSLSGVACAVATTRPHAPQSSVADVIVETEKECRAGGGDSYLDRCIMHRLPGRFVAVMTGAAPCLSVAGDRCRRFTVEGVPGMAGLTALHRFGVDRTDVLVEVSVNGGAGAPPHEGFLVTDMHVVEGVPEYPLGVAQLLDEQRADHVRECRARSAMVEEMRARAFGDVPATMVVVDPPTPTVRTALYATWLPDTKRLLVHVRTQSAQHAHEPFPPPAGRGWRPPYVDGRVFGVDCRTEGVFARDGSRVEERTWVESLVFERFAANPGAGL